MKRILFLVKNIRDQRYGLLCLAAYLKARGHQLDFVHVKNEAAGKEVLARIETFKPDYLGVTAMTGEIRFLMGVIAEIKAVHPDLYTILGGPHATFSSGIVEHPHIDAICRGEGEEAFAEFLDKHPQGDYLQVQNFGYQVNGETVLNPLRPLLDPNDLPFPDYDFIPRSVEDKFVVFASRNCVYSCTYCFNATYRSLYRTCGEKNTYKTMSVDRFLRELKHLKENYRFQYFYFQDDVFPMTRAWIDEFARRYPAEIGIPFHIGLNPALVREDTISKLVGAGLFSVNMAIESGSPRIREMMKRPKMSNQQIIDLCRVLKKNGVYIYTQNITMSPTETIEEAWQTLELNIASGVDSGSVAKFQPYPGTVMARMAVDLGYVVEADLANIPENYHWNSVLNFPEEQEIWMDNLVHLFSFTIRYPYLRWLVKPLLKHRLDWLFHRIDDQFWMTYTHRSMEQLVEKSPIDDLRVSALFFWRLLFPKDKQTFVY